MPCRFDNTGEYACGKQNCFECPGYYGDVIPADRGRPAKRVRDRSNRNPNCFDCRDPIQYGPDMKSRMRCPTCTRIHNNKRDQITAQAKASR